MRLVCPNCGAQYEVDPSVIPDSGRDVQCSACGFTWFQPGADPAQGGEPSAGRLQSAPDVAPPPRVEPERIAPDAPGPEIPRPHVEPAGPAEPEVPEPEPEVEPAPDEWPDETPVEWPEESAAESAASEPEAAMTDASHGTSPANAPAPELRRQTLDDAVMAILKDEAEREQRARIDEGAAIETQPDLGLSASAAVAAAAAPFAERGVDLRDRDVAEAHAEEAHRRAPLPDIEEINSTLRSTSDRAGDAASVDAPETLRRRRGGFRLGFVTSLVVMLVMMAAYFFAPAIAARMPAAAPALERYVTVVDAVRAGLDGMLRSSTEAMRPAATTGN